MTTNIELYEALKPTIGEEPARLIAEAMPAAQELVTKADLQLFRQEVRGDLAEFKADVRGWMLQFFVPLWIGVYATLGALIVSIVVKG